LAEAWENLEKQHPGGALITPEGDFFTGSPSQRLIPADTNERIAIARRIVADRCLYGVDINPMAVEMAKLSLWLITLQRDRPFNFLDHALKCGDSLLGVGSLWQIENFTLQGNKDGYVEHTFASANLFRYLEEATSKRRALEDLLSNNPAQIETKHRLNAEAEVATAKVKALADTLIAFELRGLKGKSYDKQRAAAADGAEAAMREPLPEFQIYAREQLHGHRPFHWALEFPEVFARGGFDAFIGNPPFMHGSWISSTFGDEYANFLRQVTTNAVGKIDFAVYFLRRAASFTAEQKSVGLVVTSKIKEGAARIAGYDTLVRNDWTIYFANSDLPWPGAAGVIVSCVCMTKRKWFGEPELNGVKVLNIDSRLEANDEELSIFPLSENKDTLYLGAKPDSLGFTLSPDVTCPGPSDHG
jgi:hypothetical protein